MWHGLEIGQLLDKLHRKKRPLILAGRKGKPRLPDFLDHFHAIDFRTPDPDPLQQLIWGITGERGSMRPD